MNFVTIKNEISLLFENNDTLTGAQIDKQIPYFQALNKDIPSSEVIEVSSEDEIKELVTVTLNLSLCQKDSFTEQSIFSFSELSSKKPLTKDLIINALLGLTTHPLKNNEPSTFSGNIFQKSDESNTYGLSSANVPEQKEGAFSLNAALLKLSKLSTLTFSLNGNSYTLPDLITFLPSAEPLFIALGVPKEVYQQAQVLSQQMLLGSFPQSVSGPILFWPLDNSYIQVTPVPSAKVIRNIRKAIYKENSQDSESYVRYRNKSLGGTQSQNVSDLNAKLGGKNPMLNADLSFLTNKKDNLNIALESNQPLFRLQYKLASECLNKVSLHHKEIGKYKRQIMILTVESMALLFDYKERFINGEELMPIPQFVERQFVIKPDHANRAEFAQYILSKITKYWVSQKIDVDNTVKKATLEAVNNTLATFT